MRTGFEGDRPVPNGIGVVDGVLRAAMATLHQERGREVREEGEIRERGHGAGPAVLR